MTGKNNYRFLIVTGLSGSGKTTASRCLEDQGYYCVDNLPAKLISLFVDLWNRREVEIERVALIVDIREAGFITEFPKVLESIRERSSPWVIFFDASDSTLMKRFNESRRPHPLRRSSSVRESIQLERKRTSRVKGLADEVIDTTETSVIELKKILARKFSKKTAREMHIAIISFGYKFGIPVDSDLVFDTRFLPNPFYVDKLRDKTGKTKNVRDFVLNSLETEKFLEKLYEFIDYLMPNFMEEGKSYLTISLGCTGGKHRSVVLAEKMGDHLKSRNCNVIINHRDIFK